jgi:hypothetical protein
VVAVKATSAPTESPTALRYLNLDDEEKFVDGAELCQNEYVDGLLRLKITINNVVGMNSLKYSRTTTYALFQLLLVPQAPGCS